MDRTDMEASKIEKYAEQTRDSGVSRRKFLILMGSTGAVAALAACTPKTTTINSTQTSTTTVTNTSAPAKDTYMFFNQSEAVTIQSICGRIIPSAAGDPGAIEAKAYIYIDHALAGYYSSQQQTYRRGLAAMDAYSQSKYQQNFSALTGAQQDSVLTDMQTGTATGFSGPDAVPFFNTLLQHVREGTFCDPLYGGNQGAIGWKMIGFPGATVAYGDTDMVVGADQSKKNIITLADEESIPMPMPSGPSAGF
jgi:gluconate 2-dehydrogenase gamma chain